MLFNSIQFLAFFIVFLPVYFFVPSDRRWLPILVASYLFYMAWNVSLSALLMGLTVTAFGSAIAIERSAAPRIRQAILTAGICAELVPLLIFKYTNFVIRTTNDLGVFLGSTSSLPYVSLILPVGISFHTFQMIGYLIDVHTGRVSAERHFGRFAGFVVFFPQLVAGPIERSYHMLPQFWRPTRLEYVRVRDGLLQAGWGLSKKVCVADLVAPFVAGVYANPRNYNGSYLLIATVLFSIQIYCDFSGYTDMALGIAKILGYDLMANFRQPYFSTSLAEFWRRWHISLSTWFRDYVYIPLGGNRVSGFRWVFNIMIVFILSGVWHGPAWTFVIWGALHGLWLVIETTLRQTSAQRDAEEDAECGTHRPDYRADRLVVGWVVTNFVVLVSWVFFRAESVGDAFYILTHLIDFGRVEYGTFKILNLASFELLLVVFQILVLLAVDAVLRFRAERVMRLWEISQVRWSLALALIYNVVFFGVFEQLEFIYFAF
jgi:alginate O-acetyltransferase complex protein AlgI